MLTRMTLEQKVGAGDPGRYRRITPEDLRHYPLGSILAGGNSAPDDDEKAPAADWLELADAFWNASLDAPTVGRQSR